MIPGGIMRPRARRLFAGLLALSIAGCQVPSYEVTTRRAGSWTREVSRDAPQPVAEVEHDPIRDVLRVAVGFDTKVRRLEVAEFERERDCAARTGLTGSRSRAPAGPR